MLDAVVVGGGVIGLSIAFRAARSGLTVAVCDDERLGRGSSAAAGMLAPVTEVHYGEESLLALNLASAAKWPAFAEEVSALTGRDLGYSTAGTLAVGFDFDDQRELEELVAFQLKLGLTVELLSNQKLRELEPLLHPRCRGGALIQGDHQIDSRRLCEALAEGVRLCGGKLIDATAEVLEPGQGIALSDGTRVRARQVVVAAGCWSGSLRGLRSHQMVIRPVKGQILRLRHDASVPFLTRTVRGMAQGLPVYIVPRANGEVVVGATVEEKGFDLIVTAGAVSDLLRSAMLLVPALSELEVLESAAGLRPGTPDNGPVIGFSSVEGVVFATGHYRNGVLLAPLTAEIVTDLLHGGPAPDIIAPFAPDRFRP